jgi:hypothetical protein
MKERVGLCNGWPPRREEGKLRMKEIANLSLLRYALEVNSYIATSNIHPPHSCGFAATIEGNPHYV